MFVPLLSGVISFLVVFFITPWMIRYLRRIGLTVKDQHKPDKPLIPLSGGIAVAVGIFFSTMVYVFLRTFIYEDIGSLLLIFASLTSLLLITFIGFFDDLFIRADRETSSGLKQWQKPLLTLVAAVPLVVINAGHTTIGLPLLGVIHLGWIYPLIVIPLIVLIGSNMVNLLEGYNGIASGMGLVYLGMLGLFAYVNQSYVAAFIALVTFSALLAFYYYNKVPARILPGDSLTYLLGGTIAVIGIVGNIERAMVIVSIPFAIEFFLKLRGKFRMQSYGHYEHGKVKTDHKRIYSLVHFFTNSGKFTERQVVYFMIFIELVFASLIWI